jgi:hypothetical protein
MRKSVISLIIALIALTGLVSCQQKFVTSVDLAVDQTQIDLPGSDAGYFNLHILSNRTWTITVESERDWLHPETKEGKGTAYPKFTYDAYVGAVDREATIIIACDVKTLRIKVVQPKSE